jgi:hypothetical protein
LRWCSTRPRSSIANVAMPAALDRVLRLVVVTPAPGSRRENPEHVFR